MTNTNLTQKIDSLSIDALTQFRAGVDSVHIGNTELTAERCFENARDVKFDSIENDEERNIAGIWDIIINLVLENDSVLEELTGKGAN